MRKYSRIYTVLWQDKKIKNLEDKTRTIFIYLLSSPHVNMVGWYCLSLAYASADLGYPIDTISKGLKELQEKHLITYDEESEMIIVHNFLKYNPVRGSKQAKGAISVIKGLADRGLIIEFLSCVKKHISDNETFYEMLVNEFKDTLSEGDRYPIDTPSIPHRSTDMDMEMEKDMDNIHGDDFKNKKNKPNRDINIGQAYEKIFQRAVNPNLYQKLNSFTEEGIDESVIVEAMKRSRNKDSPPSYAIGILNNWVNKGVSTIKDVEKLDKKYRSMQKQNNEDIPASTVDREKVLAWMEDIGYEGD